MNKIVIFVLLTALNVSTIYAATLSKEVHEEIHADVLSTNSRLSLREVLEKTIARSPQQAVLAAQKYEVVAKQKMADSILPLSPSVSLLHQNDTIGSGRNERDWQAQLELPVWLPKQKSARARVAEFSASNFEMSTDQLQLQVAGALRDAVWIVALNRNEVELYQQKLSHAEKLEADIRRKFEAGELAKTDLMLVQQETLLAQKNLIRAEAELMHAHFRYSQLTGLNEIPENVDESQSALIDFYQSPRWKSAEAKVALAQSERDLSAVERRENPHVIFNARSSQDAFDVQYNQSVGVQIRIPFDTEVSSAPILAASEQVYGEAISQRESLRRLLETDLHEAEHNLLVSKKELSIADQQFNIAKSSEELAQKAYHLGELDLMSLLRIRSQSFEAERGYTTRQLQVKWDIARYNQAVGVLP
jgi:outer membrane protein, heavy metal efflux system